MKNVDWAVLRKQKETLVSVIANSSNDKVSEDLTGILHLIDALQDDSAANSEIGLKEVYGVPV